APTTGNPTTSVDVSTDDGGASTMSVSGTAPSSGSHTSDTGLTDASSSEVEPAVCPETYSNPVIWEDLPDVEVIRVDDAYYYTASTFHYSPGAPLLRSYDLVHWEYVSHSVPKLDFASEYDLAGDGSYVNGIWASTLQYRKSNETFY